MACALQNNSLKFKAQAWLAHSKITLSAIGFIGKLMCTRADSYFEWTIDNRMKKADITEQTTQIEYVYDISGSRILKRSLKVNNVTDGTRYRYCSGNGTSYLDGSGNVRFYLGSGAAASDWKRFERNIEEDWESVSGASWTNTDGILIRPSNTANYDFYIDHLRFSNSRTKTHNTLSGGSVGQIVSAKNYISDTYGQPQDAWYSYDHIGNVVNLSSSTGAKTAEYAQDAFGNVLSSAITGAWATSADGRHLTTKEYDDNVDFYYFWQRWYDPELGRFLSKSNYNFSIEAPYVFSNSNPVSRSDPSGELSAEGCECFGIPDGDYPNNSCEAWVKKYGVSDSNMEACIIDKCKKMGKYIAPILDAVIRGEILPETYCWGCRQIHVGKVTLQSVLTISRRVKWIGRMFLFMNGRISAVGNMVKIQTFLSIAVRWEIAPL